MKNSRLHSFPRSRYFCCLMTLLLGSCFVGGVVKAQEQECCPPGEDPESALILLKNGDLELGLLPKVGGSAVLFRLRGHENVLYAPTDHWLDWDAHLPDPLDLSQWTDFFGHIIWLSPQTDFWNQQDDLESQHDQLWPPDPYWVYGDFKVLEQDETHVVLEGPSSPYTGIKMIKRYELSENGAKLSVTGINVTDRVLRWGLWSNTRVSGDTAVYVPVANEQSFRIESPDASAIPYAVEGGFFHFSLGIAEGEGETPHSKAYLYPDSHWLAGVRNGQVFVKLMEPVDRSEIHPNHGVFEVYHLRPNPETSHPGLTEMEAHAPYLELQPGEAMTLSERWMIFEVGEPQGQETIEWLRSHRSELDAAEVSFE